MSEEILLGYELETGREVTLPKHHTVITGMTQLSGKTTAMEGLVYRSGAKAIAFLTKRGESGFQGQREIPAYFKEQKKGNLIDWQYVESILEATMGEKMKFERYWITEICKGARSLEEVYTNAKAAQANAKRALDAAQYSLLTAYFEIVLPETKRYPFTDKIALEKGFNVMNLIGMADEMQQLVIESTISLVLKTMHDVVVVIPEAHKFIPQGKNTPVKATALRFIREGAALHNFLWIDSQETTSVDKSTLKQVSNWIMGYQQEKNEVANVKETLNLTSEQAEKIPKLKLGQFAALIYQKLSFVYALPNGIDPEMGRAVAMGRLDVSAVKNILASKRPMNKWMDGVKLTYQPADASEISPNGPPPTIEEGIMSLRISNLQQKLSEDEEAFRGLDEVIAKKDAYIDQLIAQFDEVSKQKDELILEFGRFKSTLSSFGSLLLNEQPLVSPYAKSAITPEVHETLTVTKEVEKLIEEIFDRKIAKLGKAKVAAAVQGETQIPWVNSWLPKLTNGTQKKLLILIAQKHPLKLKKSVIAQLGQYTPGSGTFNGNLSQLVTWGLVVKDGDEYGLSEVPR